MNDSRIQAFLAVSETGSMALAAKQLYITQSTLSYRIRELENELGVTLFLRSRGSKSVVLTREGRLFYPVAERLRSSYADVRQFMERAPRAKEPLRIGIIDSLHSSPFACVFQKVFELDPCVHINIKTLWYYEIYRLLETRELDLGFVSRSMPSRNVEQTPLFTERLYLVHRRGSPLHSEVGSAFDLDPSRAVGLNLDDHYGVWFSNTFGSPAPTRITTDKYSTMTDFVVKFDLWAFVPASLANSCKEAGLVVRVVGDEPPWRTIYMLQRKTEGESVDFRCKAAAIVEDYVSHLDFGMYETHSLILTRPAEHSETPTRKPF